jgi:hypothetical protein
VIRRARILAPLLAVLALLASAAGAPATAWPQRDTERSLVVATWLEGREGVVVRVLFVEVGALVSQESAWKSAFEVVRLESPESPLRIRDVTRQAVTAEEIGFDDEPALRDLELLQSVEVELAEPLDPGGAYGVRIAGAVFRVFREDRLIPYSGGLEPIGRERIVADAVDLLSSAQQAREDQGISLSAGEQTGMLSFHYRRHLTGFGNGLWNLEASLDGDVTIDQDSRFDYFNQVEARLQGYRGFRYDLGGRLAYGEFGLHYELQSDQKLQNGDHKVGVQIATVIKDPLTTTISEALTPPGHASNVPLWVLELDYVDEAFADADSAPQKPDTENGDFRAELSLDWRMAVGRGLDWDFIPSIGPIRKVDLLVAANVVWDAEEDEFFDTSRVTLRFSPDSTVAGASTSIDVTWARGEPGPVFEEFSALMIGLRIGR